MAKRVKKSVKGKVTKPAKRVKLSDRGEGFLEDFSKAAVALGIAEEIADGKGLDNARNSYDHCRASLANYIGILEAKVVMLRRAK